MNGGMYLVQDNGDLIEMSEHLYDSEAVLQELLAKYPNLLAGHQMDSEDPRRWLLVKREMGLPSDEIEGNRWSVDHLFLDQDGIPTLVEVKRSTNSEIHRKIVGQLLEYAAHAVLYWPVERIIAELERRCEKEGIDLESTMADLLDPDGDPSQYWDRVRTNLQAGHIRLVFVADAIPSELRRIVEFLNEQMSPADVFALEVKQYVGEGVKTLVPRLIGASELKHVSSRSAKHQWTEEEFFTQLRNENGPDIAEVVKKLLTNLRSISGMEIWWGQGNQTGSFVPRIWKNGRKYQFFTLYSARARIEFAFGVLKNRPEFASEERREMIRARLNAIDGFSVPKDKIGKFPSLPVEPLIDKNNRESFVAILKWMIEEIRKA